MARIVGIGIQSFEKLIMNQYFYIDKTDFIREWWENGDEVTLITRPRRFGKTLNMNMVERFFSIEYKDQGSIFEDLSIWKSEMYQKLQGTYPVIFVSFADVKEVGFYEAKNKICKLIQLTFDKYRFLLEGDLLTEREKEDFCEIANDIENSTFSLSLKMLSFYLFRYYGKKVIILLDEYDTPLQEAYVYGYWKEMAGFMRSLFNSTFKTNPYLERAIMTGITRVSKESIFSDLNNLEVITTTSEKYENSFGFTEKEVWDVLAEWGLYGERQNVKDWYDGFIFGKTKDIYNPWSILNYLDKKRFSAYWVNTSSNSLIDMLIREGSTETKIAMEDLMQGKHLYREIDEQIVFEQLNEDENAIWNLLLASGYLKVENYTLNEDIGEELYELALTNKEVYIMFRKLIKKWFSNSASMYNGFIKALLRHDINSMNAYMNRVALATFSYFDTGKKPSEDAEPERFYHGFVLGLMVELADRYVITSNRESGFGRYDVVLEPKQKGDDAIIIEFKVRKAKNEPTLEDTAREALAQIKRQKYEAILESRGIPLERIQKYGFAFEGKEVLILS